MFVCLFFFDVWESVIYPLYHWLQYHLLRAAISFSFLTIFPDHSLLSFPLILLLFNIILLFMIPYSSFINSMPFGNLLQMPCFFHEIFLWPFMNFWRYFLLLDFINTILIALFLSSIVEFYFKTASKIVYSTQISHLPLDVVDGLSWIHLSSSVTGILLSATSQG